MLAFFQFALASFWSFVGVVFIVFAFAFFAEVIIINIANGTVAVIRACRKDK